MIEALWSVEFVANTGDFGAGVVVFETGRVFGGDATYFYVGSYEIKDGVACASIEVTHYAGPLNNVFGPLRKVTLDLSGPVGYENFTVTGSAKEAPGMITVRLTRRAELP